MRGDITEVYLNEWDHLHSMWLPRSARNKTPRGGDAYGSPYDPRNDQKNPNKDHTKGRRNYATEPGMIRKEEYKRALREANFGDW